MDLYDLINRPDKAKLKEMKDLAASKDPSPGLRPNLSKKSVKQIKMQEHTLLTEGKDEDEDHDEGSDAGDSENEDGEKEKQQDLQITIQSSSAPEKKSKGKKGKGADKAAKKAAT